MQSTTLPESVKLPQIHRFKYNLIEDPYCVHCKDIYETTEHFLFDCPSYIEARTQLLNQLSDMGIDINDKSILLTVILQGENMYDVADTLITIVTNYLTQTKIFK